MGVFKLDPKGLDAEELELELIDAGLDEMGESETDKGDPLLIVRCEFESFGDMQNALEEKGVTVVESGLEFIANTLTKLDEEQATDVLKLVDAMEQDDDVNDVFHNLE